MHGTSAFRILRSASAAGSSPLRCSSLATLRSCVPQAMDSATALLQAKVRRTSLSHPWALSPETALSPLLPSYRAHGIIPPFVAHLMHDPARLTRRWEPPFEALALWAHLIELLEQAFELQLLQSL